VSPAGCRPLLPHSPHPLVLLPQAAKKAKATVQPGKDGKKAKKQGGQQQGGQQQKQGQKQGGQQKGQGQQKQGGQQQKGQGQKGAQAKPAAGGALSPNPKNISLQITISGSSNGPARSPLALGARPRNAGGAGRPLMGLGRSNQSRMALAGGAAGAKAIKARKIRVL
jgi:hypothetical protein